MDHKRNIAKLLHAFADALEASSPADLDAVLEGRAFFAVTTQQPRRDERREKRDAMAIKHTSRGSKDLAGLAEQLTHLGSREEGSGLLERSQLKKQDLESLARMMDLPILRSDDMERLKQKIIEQSIGARLNSQAIRGR